MAQRKIPFWASVFVSDIGNGDANIIDPGSTKQQNGWVVEKPKLQHMNWILGLFGKYLTSFFQNRKVTTGELEAGDCVIVDNLTSSRTIELMADPLDGQWCEVQIVELNQHTVTVDGNGNDIMVVSDTICEMNLRGVYRFIYDESVAMYKVEYRGEGGMVDG